jgi:O-6-methylguanine DNA methyltransferase
VRRDDWMQGDVAARVHRIDAVAQESDLDAQAWSVLRDLALTGLDPAMFERPKRGFELPLDVRGTAFQQRVWQALRAIPPGATETYSSIALKIGAARSVRAVAGACAANLHAVAIPCHRVVRQDGDLSGYRWGVERKRELIERESRAQERAA